jgi:tRNA(fMet)-specific endonuclease VapC
MSLFILDTDTLSNYYRGHPNVVRAVDERPASEIAISVITVDEQLSGWYALTRQVRKPVEIARAYAMLGEAVVQLAEWRILPYTEPAIERATAFNKQRLNVRKMDLRIAAITLENDATVVTCNRRDFERVPGLRVEDWSV